ncbi:AI-2E family transporter [Sediminicoccus rosea]|jgi:predicted PurR-regulated permease PerM|uniref:AI-2E family transporter n=1 Tax=Sediminicoccus rosea TaxID=1225128 RepID=A0ABZ0PE81_9PROT|nr:AI-2E family transporter [Sediminicoccus rosea]WPB83998.1 AI-2E family transporter [Sediminicoccus rosea]
MMENKEQLARLVGFIAAGALAAGCFLVLKPFISALMWAVILVFCTWPAYRFLTDRLRLGAGSAAGVMVSAEFLLIGLPLVFATPVRREDIEGIRNWLVRVFSEGLPDLSGVFLLIPMVGPYLNDWWQALAGDASHLVAAIRPYAGDIAQFALSLLLGLLSGVAEMLIAILLAFFIYKDGPALAKGAYGLLERLAGVRAPHLWELTGNVTRGVVYGMLGTAVAQGFMTFFGLWISGVPQPVLLAVIAGVISILPVGAPLVWIPASIWLLATGSIGWGIFLALYGGLGISSVDNVIRPWFISRGADLPLLLTILGALGGVLAFGFLGLFLGPVLLALGYTLIKEWATGEAEEASPEARPPV